MKRALLLLAVANVAHAKGSEVTRVAGKADPSLCAGRKSGCIAMATANAPSPRSDEALVWTGHELIVWGGETADGKRVDDGAVFDPANNSWRAMATKGAPSSAGHPLVVWTGERMFVWAHKAGALYDPHANAWTPIASGGPDVDGEPYHGRAWVAGAMVLVFPAGPQPLQLSGNGFRYDPKTNHWDAMPATPLASRHFADIAVGGGKLFVWGGMKPNSAIAFGDGALYDPVANTWKSITSQNAPRRRYASTTYWDGHDFVVRGGQPSQEDDPHLVTLKEDDGARYDPARDAWTPGPGSTSPAHLDWLPQSFDFEQHYRLGPDFESLYGYNYGGDYYAPDHRDLVPKPIHVDGTGRTQTLPLARGADWIIVGRMNLTDLYRRDAKTGVFSPLPAIGDGKRTYRLIAAGGKVIAWGGEREIERHEAQCPSHCPRGAPCAVPPPCVYRTVALQNDGMIFTP